VKTICHKGSLTGRSQIFQFRWSHVCRQWWLMKAGGSAQCSASSLMLVTDLISQFHSTNRAYCIPLKHAKTTELMSRWMEQYKMTWTWTSKASVNNAVLSQSMIPIWCKFPESCFIYSRGIKGQGIPDMIWMHGCHWQYRAKAISYFNPSSTLDFVLGQRFDHYECGRLSWLGQLYGAL